MIKRSMHIALSLLIVTSSTLAYSQNEPVPNADPYEPFNRAMFNFNESLDKNILKPIAKLYNKIIPKPLNKGISRFFANIDTVPTIANDLFEANFYQATSDAWRLLINTTVGLFGFFDPATSLGLEPHTADLGLTLAKWGYKNSDYLVLPVLGPITVRDALAWPVNYQYLTVYPYIHPDQTRYELYGVELISKRANLLHYSNVMQQAALDKYAFVRSAYLQRRQYEIEQVERGRPTGHPTTHADTVNQLPEE